MDGLMQGSLCKYFPDVFFFAVVLFMGTYVAVHLLSSLRTSIYFPTRVRNLVADYAVPITILIMSGINYAVGLKVPRLGVPTNFQPTKTTGGVPRSWFINPFAVKPGWLPIFAILPGALFTILNVVGQGIVTAIVNRKEHRLQKGFGYHLDLMVLAIATFVSAFLGVPFYVCSPVVSLTHLSTLKRYSDSAAPGEKPQFLGIREQRISGFLSLLLVALTVLLGPVLRMIPSAVLFGIFFYMGVASLYTQAMWLRLLLFFIPVKYQPDYKYLRLVKLKRVHLYTIIQVTGFVLLMVVNEIQQIAIIFPIAVVMLMGLRKLIEKIFSDQELVALDQELPSLRDIWRPLNHEEGQPGCCGRFKGKMKGMIDGRKANRDNGGVKNGGIDGRAYSNTIVEEGPDE